MSDLLSQLTGFFSGGAARYSPDDGYMGLRGMLLRTSWTVGDGLPVSAVLMETGYSQEVVTLVVTLEGPLGLYYSNGAAVVGLGVHSGPRQAARDLLQTAPDFLKFCTLNTTFPLPLRGSTRFYLVAPEGVLSVEAKLDDLEHGRHPMYPLFCKAHALIGEIHAVGLANSTTAEDHEQDA